MYNTSERRLMAICFTDIIGYTALSEKDVEAALLAVESLQHIAKKITENHGGRIVKYIGDAVLSVFNLKGKFIKTLFHGIALADSIQYISWYGEDFTGKKVSSGPYFYQLKTHSSTTTKKMLLLK